MEVDIAFEETVDATVVSRPASKETVGKFIYEAKRLGVYSIVDIIDVSGPLYALEGYKELPDVVTIHRAIGAEKGGVLTWGLVSEIKKPFIERKILVAVAGRIEPSKLTMRRLILSS